MRSQDATRGTLRATIFLSLLALGCSEQQGSATDCVPICSEPGAADGCGGICDGTLQPSDPEANGECVDSCASTGASCGTVCGRPCGMCSQGLSCSVGGCVAAANCETCELRLTIDETHELIQGHDEVVVGIEFDPLEGAELPRMAEFRLEVEGPAKLVEARSGPALLEAGKDLYRDSFTGNAFKEAFDGAYRLLAYGTASADEIRAGRIANLRLEVDGNEPVSVRLQRREQTFAPATADAQLQSTSYDQPLVVKP